VPTAQGYSGVSLLTKCDEVFSNPKGLVFWKVESSALAIQLKAEKELFPRNKGKISHFLFHKTSTRAIRLRGRRGVPSG